MRRRVAFLSVLLLVPTLTWAHTMMMTQVLVSFQQPGLLDIRIDVDLTLLFGSAERYYEVAGEPPERQQQDIAAIVPRLLENLQLFTGEQRLSPVLQKSSPPQAQRSDYLDSSISKPWRLSFVAELPATAGPLKLVVPLGAAIDYPIAYTVQIPAAHVSVTRWLEEGMHESQPFAWAEKVPESLPWRRQLALYLQLGFHHIVPEGADHILFVLGLFFLGITWRKLLSQTTVFTVAHATTLALSTYGVFRLPSRYVEPAIALSIAVIALENVFRPKLGPQRLAIVFGFGLIHGLGFASSLREIPFPQHDFLIALLGFNFGVDFGQLFVIGLAFAAVGAFRNQPWFRRRIAVPCSLAIAVAGLAWAVQRVFGYW